MSETYKNSVESHFGIQEYSTLEEGVNNIIPILEEYEQDNGNSIIIVAGPTAAGKGTFVDKIANSDTTVLSIDRYYLSPEEQIAKYGKVNFSTPNSIDTERLNKDLAALIESRIGDQVLVPVYSMTESKRVSEETIKRAKRLIVEGIYAIEQVKVDSPFKIYINTSHESMLSRKLNRDVNERGIEKAVVIQRFEENVVPATTEYVEPQKSNANFIIDNES